MAEAKAEEICDAHETAKAERFKTSGEPLEVEFANMLDTVDCLIEAYKELRAQHTAKCLIIDELVAERQSYTVEQISDLQDALRDAQAENSVLCDQILALELRNAERDTDWLPPAVKSEETIDELSNLNAELLQQNEDNKRRIAELDVEIDKTTALKHTVAELNRENTALQVRLETEVGRTSLVPAELRNVFRVENPFNEFLVLRLLSHDATTEREQCDDEVQAAFDIVERATGSEVLYAVKRREANMGELEKQILQRARVL